MEINQVTNITKKLFFRKYYEKTIQISHDFHKTSISDLFGREKIDF